MNKNKINLCGLLLMIAFSALKGQNLYMPIDIKEAYDKGTRDMKGIPGAFYWQNHSDYNIDVHFDPESGLVSGKAKIVYFNNSPDDLDHIVLRLYQDHFKKGMARNRNIDSTDLTDGVKILSLTSPTDSIGIINRSGTKLYVFLKDFLFPKDSLVLIINWEFSMPKKENQRFGKYHDAWFIALWYPQVAVYDDITGWDTYNFEWEQEFYNDFNNFMVNITVPKEYLVDATGILQNPEETFHKNILAKYNEAKNSPNVIHIVTIDDIETAKISNKNKLITWQYKADHIPDFAFTVCQNFIWDGKSIVIIDQEDKQRKVFVSSIYHPLSKDFFEVTDIAGRSIAYFSNQLPGVAFPYPKLTVFNGAKGGMEYPMIVNNASSVKKYYTVMLTSHEIFHSYFPFYMGINESKYAWMDEGWAEFAPIEFQKNEEADFDFLAELVSTYETYAGKSEELVPMFPTAVYNSNAINEYRVMSYFRAGAAYYVLQNILGKELFKKALRDFIINWNGKHPTPYDFFYSFNQSTEQDLSWFWQPWFFEQGYPDLQLSMAEQKENLLTVKIEKKGNIPVPLIIRIIYEDAGREELEYAASIWQSTNIFEVTKQVDRKIKTVTITHRHVPDADKNNNTYHFENEQ